jgi:hypothetical protein
MSSPPLRTAVAEAHVPASPEPTNTEVSEHTTSRRRLAARHNKKPNREEEGRGWRTRTVAAV